MKNRRRNLLIGLIVLTWLLGMVLGYFVNHKPFEAELLIRLVQAAWRMIAAAWLTWLAGAIGWKFLRVDGLHPLARLSIQAGLGFGCLALGFLIIGSIALPTWLPWVLSILLSLLFFRAGLEWARGWRALPQAWAESSGFGRAVGWISAILLFCAFLTALAPPVKYDALMYHLTLPQAYLRDGRITDLAWNIFSGMPQNTEMLFTWAMSLADAQAAVLLGWCFAVLGLVGAWGWLRGGWGERPAWIGVAALACGGSLIAVAAGGYTDWLGILFAFSSTILLEHALQKENRAYLLWAGIFAGLALGTKYTSGLLAAACLAALCWSMLQTKKFRLTWLLLFGGMVCAAFLPWLVKNALWTGNPAYPFFFPSGTMTQLRLDGYQNTPPSGNWQDFILLPLRATLLGVEGAGTYGSSIGPLLLGLGALAFLGAGQRTQSQNRQLSLCAALALSGLLLWAVANQLSGALQQTRYAFTLFPALLPLVAAGSEGISTLRLGKVRLRVITAALIFLALGANLLEISLSTLRQGSLQLLLGQKSDSEYLTDNLGWFQVALEAVNQLPEGSKVLFLYEARGFYCDPRCTADEILDRWRRDVTTFGTDEKILASWREQGYTHILVFSTGVEFLRGAEDPHHPPYFFQRLDAFLPSLPAPTRFGNDYALYSLGSQ